MKYLDFSKSNKEIKNNRIEKRKKNPFILLFQQQMKKGFLGINFVKSYLSSFVFASL